MVGDRINKINYKEIDYLGTKVKVSINGDIIWNGKSKNIYCNNDGYLVCSIKTEKGWRSVSVARLVAIAYIPNPKDLPEVNHKDYNRRNPNVNNLEWISRMDNIAYSKCHRPDFSGCKNPNYNNNKLSKLYEADKIYAKEKQGRPALQNGRCRKIKMFLNNIFIKEFDYIVDCCKYIQENYTPNCTLNGIRTMIDKSIRFNKTYKNLTFIKE